MKVLHVLMICAETELSWNKGNKLLGGRKAEKYSNMDFEIYFAYVLFELQIFRLYNNEAINISGCN